MAPWPPLEPPGSVATWIRPGARTQGLLQCVSRLATFLHRHTPSTHAFVDALAAHTHQGLHFGLDCDSWRQLGIVSDNGSANMEAP
eukprot:5933009-Pyramimonas_sp.AAC.1